MPAYRKPTYNQTRSLITGISMIATHFYAMVYHFLIAQKKHDNTAMLGFKKYLYENIKHMYGR